MTPNWKSFLPSVGGLLNRIPILGEVMKITKPDKGTTQSYDVLHVLCITYNLYSCFRWNMTVCLDVGGCAGRCITKSVPQVITCLVS